MTDTTCILITGSNRGVGKGLVAKYITRPNHVVIAGVRDPALASSKALYDLPRGTNSKIILEKIDSALETSALSAIQDLTSTYSLRKLDVVIANAGICAYYGKAIETPAEQMLDHFRVNTVGSLLLFQACAPLLNAAPAPKFVAISSGAGSISVIEKLNMEITAYGASKAALNFVTRKIHAENPGIVVFPINPGWLQTDGGNQAAAMANMTSAPVSVEDGVAGLIDKIDRATREEASGKFLDFSGGELEW